MRIMSTPSSFQQAVVLRAEQAHYGCATPPFFVAGVATPIHESQAEREQSTLQQGAQRPVDLGTFRGVPYPQEDSWQLPGGDGAAEMLILSGAACAVIVVGGDCDNAPPPYLPAPRVSVPEGLVDTIKRSPHYPLAVHIVRYHAKCCCPSSCSGGRPWRLRIYLYPLDNATCRRKRLSPVEELQQECVV